MISKVYAVYDNKAEAYMLPFFASTVGIAIRMFTNSVNDKNTTFNKYPNDFVLFELGEFEDSNGTFKAEKAPRNLGMAIEFIIKEGEK